MSLNPLYQPLLFILKFLTNSLDGNLGLAILTLTFLIRLVLIPLTVPGMKVAKKMRELKPHLDELKKKYAKDKKRLQQEQLKLYQQHKVNPLSGCLPQIVQIVVVFALYRVFIDFLENGNLNGANINLSFLGMNLAEPDTTYVMPILAGLSQLIFALIILPGADTTAEKTLAASTPSKKDDKKAEDVTEMSETMQKQMVYIFPAMIFFMSLKFPSGLALYWVASTTFLIIQQYFISGPGGLAKFVEKIKGKIRVS